MASPNEMASAKGGAAKARAAQAALLARSSNLPGPPFNFDPSKQYRVRLTKTVSPDGFLYLRPTDDVVIRGDYALTIIDSISGAQAVE